MSAATRTPAGVPAPPASIGLDPEGTSTHLEWCLARICRIPGALVVQQHWLLTRAGRGLTSKLQGASPEVAPQERLATLW
eukprot:563185-Pyramimonas_sp.AAC.1